MIIRDKILMFMLCALQEIVLYVCMYDFLFVAYCFISVLKIHDIGLQNDHKALMKLIEDGIHDVHTAARNKRDSENSSQQTSSGNSLVK